jgi:orotate phosphoribosyltransferase
MDWFIEAMIEEGALWMSGHKTMRLRSGRQSPFFFNTGDLSSGRSIGMLARGYAQRIIEAGLENFALFGPAYKGISLATATALTLYRDHERDIEFAFNRKEAKTHGEKGSLIGSPLEGKFVVIIDDVITDGATKHEAFEFVKDRGGIPVAIVIAFDRMERASAASAHSALWQLRADLGVPIYSIATVRDLLAYLRSSGAYVAEQAAIERYLQEYGADE